MSSPQRRTTASKKMHTEKGTKNCHETQLPPHKQKENNYDDSPLQPVPDNYSVFWGRAGKNKTH